MNEIGQQDTQAQKQQAQIDALMKFGLCEQQVERLTQLDKLAEIYDEQYVDRLLRFASACNKAAQRARQHADALQRKEA